MNTNRASKNFGKIVREMREKNNWTQEHLAAELDVAASWISMIESGKKSPKLETVIRLADAFDVKIYFGEKKL